MNISTNLIKKTFSTRFPSYLLLWYQTNNFYCDLKMNFLHFRHFLYLHQFVFIFKLYCTSQINKILIYHSFIILPCFSLLILLDFIIVCKLQHSFRKNIKASHLNYFIGKYFFSFFWDNVNFIPCIILN